MKPKPQPEPAPKCGACGATDNGPFSILTRAAWSGTEEALACAECSPKLRAEGFEDV